MLFLKGVGAPEYYLDGNIDDVKDKQWQEEGVFTALLACTYIENAMEKLQQLCGVEQFCKANTPMNNLYHPETDEMPLLDDEHASKYQCLIGSANCALGRFDIAYATMALARYLMAPREGHF
jgi:hypothetical protein